MIARGATDAVDVAWVSVEHDGMTGYGEAISKGTAGDLYIKINITPHPVFRREGSDLVMNLNLKLSDALLGTKYPIQTLDGEIEVTIPSMKFCGCAARACLFPKISAATF